jgi:hypothetical protein
VCNLRIMKNNNSKKLIEVLLKTIDRVGIKQTIESLQITEIHITENKVLQDAIIGLTCKHFQISKKMLIAGRRNIPNRTNAIGICALLLSRYCKITQRDIGKILRKEVSNVNKYIKKYQDLDVNFKEDKEIIQKMQLIENDINEFLTNGNNTKILTDG